MTIDAATAAEYRRARREWRGAMPAHIALAVARQRLAPGLELEIDGKAEEWESDGWTMRARVRHDELYTADDWLGEFTGDEPGDVSQTGAGHDRFPRYQGWHETTVSLVGGGSRTELYYGDITPRGSRRDQYRYITLAQYDYRDTRQGFARQGMSRHLADLAARALKAEEVAHLERAGDGCAGGVYVEVEATRAGVTLGRAGCGTDWGFADDDRDDRANWRTLVAECAEDAIAAAEDTLAQLCARG